MLLIVAPYNLTTLHFTYELSKHLPNHVVCHLRSETSTEVSTEHLICTSPTLVGSSDQWDLILYVAENGGWRADRQSSPFNLAAIPTIDWTRPDPSAPSPETFC